MLTTRGAAARRSTPQWVAKIEGDHGCLDAGLAPGLRDASSLSLGTPWIDTATLGETLTHVDTAHQSNQ